MGKVGRKVQPGPGLAEALGRGVAAAGPRRISLLRPLALAEPVYSMNAEWAGAWEQESGPKKPSSPSRSPRRRVPAGFSSIGEERDREGRAASTWVKAGAAQQIWQPFSLLERNQLVSRLRESLRAPFHLRTMLSLIERRENRILIHFTEDSDHSVPDKHLTGPWEAHHKASPIWVHGPVWLRKYHYWRPKNEIPGCGSLTWRETQGQHGRGCDVAVGCRATGRLSVSSPQFGNALPARTCRAGERGRRWSGLCRALLQIALAPGKR